MCGVCPSAAFSRRRLVRGDARARVTRPRALFLDFFFPSFIFGGGGGKCSLVAATIEAVAGLRRDKGIPGRALGACCI